MELFELSYQSVSKYNNIYFAKILNGFELINLINIRQSLPCMGDWVLVCVRSKSTSFQINDMQFIKWKHTCEFYSAYQGTRSRGPMYKHL